MTLKAPRYPRKRPPGSFTRLIVEISNDEVADIDDWGLSAEMPSRAAAVRHLIKTGLQKEKAPEHGLGNRSDASDQ